jgi:PAS domain S-box-containing protein
LGRTSEIKPTGNKLPPNAQEIILDSISCGVFTVDNDWRITSFNRAAEQIIGIPREEALGRPCREVLRGDICEGKCALQETLRTGKPIIGRPFELIDVEGKRRPVSISTAVFKDADGRVLGGVESFRDLTVVAELRKEISRAYRFEDIISRSHLMRKVFDIITVVAETGSTVLIEGESGTGKELVARAIHSHSGRKGKAFVAVNCAALPDTLLESELFGYKAGAFTDARKDKPGRFALAEGGTLFLDEIGDISPALQVRLLRFMQEHTFEPLGSVEPVKADVRIIAATNRNLEELVREGRFREDLYFRVNVIRIHLPPLRDRMEDVPLLVEQFIKRFNRIQDKKVVGISDRALSLLMAYSFPGNVRELENVMEHAFVLCRQGEIQPEHLPESISRRFVNEGPGQNEREETASLKQLEAAFLLNALKRHNYCFRETARSLGVHKTTLYRKIKRLGIRVPSAKNAE